MSKKASLITRCCDPGVNVDDLEALYEADREIAFSTFSRHVDVKVLARNLGYSVGAERGLHLKNDYHVQFFRSTWKGVACYHMDWSCIDHIFQKPAAIH